MALRQFTMVRNVAPYATPRGATSSGLSQKPRTVALKRPSTTYSNCPLSWQRMTVNYRCSLANEASPIPIRVAPAFGCPARPARHDTLKDGADGVPVIRNNWAISFFDTPATNQATVSSNGHVRPALCMAHGTAAVTTPCSGHDTRGRATSR